MADPRTMHLDTLTRRWDLVAELVHCAYCLGALPPDVDGACEECGTGTPPGLPPVPLLIVAEEPKLTKEEMVEAALLAASPAVGAPAPVVEVEPAAGGWMAMLKSWARWPNV